MWALQSMRRVTSGTLMLLLAMLAMPVAAQAPGNPFDSLYPEHFRLRPLQTDRIVPVSKPARAHDLSEAFIDPIYGTRLYRASAVGEGSRPNDRIRHAYSRRQAFNANNTMYLQNDGEGFWYVYDATTFQKIRRLGSSNGGIRPAGECEAIWHPTDPDTFFMTATHGGPVWYRYNVVTQTATPVFDFRGRTPWPQATRFWTIREGSTSADGRYLAVVAEHAPDGSSPVTLGMVTVDLAQGQVIGTLSASAFAKPGARPDHISITPSGNYVVPSWVKTGTNDVNAGTYAYNRDFSGTPRRLHTTSEHSDLAYGPNREDFYVYADYDAGAIRAINVETLQRFDLAPIYQGNAEAYALHISGQAFDKPGWVVISSYHDNAHYGSVYPAPTLRPQYRKVWLAELKPNGRNLSLAHVRARTVTTPEYPYFLEPHASASRDLSRVIFSTTMGESGSEAEEYIIGLPSWVLD